jgi:hypothetical protein
MPVQIVPAPGWFAVLATAEPPFYELSPLVGWLFRSERREISLDGLVANDRSVGAPEPERFICYGHDSMISELQQQEWSRRGQAMR